MSQKILVLIANPQGTQSLNLLPEIRRLKEALRQSELNSHYRVEWEIVKTEKDFRKYIINHKPQLLHFAGHGTMKGLLLEDQEGNPKILNHVYIVSLLKIYSDRLNCVILNACETANLAEVLSQEINNVIGMNQEVKDEVAIVFAEGFYEALGAGETVENAFEVGKMAVLELSEVKDSQGRKFMIEQGKILDEKGQEIINCEHLIPVLKKKDDAKAIEIPSSKSSQGNRNITQSHSGKGDNIAGDKTVTNTRMINLKKGDYLES